MTDKRPHSRNETRGTMGPLFDSKREAMEILPEAAQLLQDDNDVRGKGEWRRGKSNAVTHISARELVRGEIEEKSSKKTGGRVPAILEKEGEVELSSDHLPWGNDSSVCINSASAEGTTGLRREKGR